MPIGQRRCVASTARLRCAGYRAGQTRLYWSYFAPVPPAI